MEFMQDEGVLVDVDFYKDETCMVVGMRGDDALLVDLKNKKTNSFNHRLPHPLILI
jgi:hypothetical protein